MKLDLERIQHWLSKGAQPTDRVLRFLDQAGVLKREARLNPQKAKPGKKAKERVEARRSRRKRRQRPPPPRRRLSRLPTAECRVSRKPCRGRGLIASSSPRSARRMA